ncbi:hypothetical protein [Crateriforma conspicua]|uniref:hypothetical protein n=1 Tax=Crateriforma conspicua TaxID=2527996 RepID=UPI0013FCFB7A|nr:hypothetical protein [Crateriforma conspicua]
MTDTPAIMFHLPRLSLEELVSWEVVFGGANAENPSLLWAWLAESMHCEFGRRFSEAETPEESQMMRPPVDQMSDAEIVTAAVTFASLSYGVLSAAEADFIDACTKYFLNQTKSRRGERTYAHSQA